MRFSVAFVSLAVLAFHAVHAWTPAIGDTWNYNLEAPVDVDVAVDVVFIDMDDETSQATIDELHEAGKAAVCYISIGSWEEWRDDASEFPEDAIGNELDGWDREKWLDVTNTKVQEIMATRVDRADDMNCDGVEPDNMSVHFEENAGVDVSREEQIAYNKWFAGIVRGAGMKVGLKNVVDILPDLVDYFDFAVNEECFQFTECHEYSNTFLDQGKPVFNVEYVDQPGMCNSANELGLDTILKNPDLKTPFCSCSDPCANIGCSEVRNTGAVDV